MYKIFQISGKIKIDNMDKTRQVVPDLIDTRKIRNQEQTVQYRILNNILFSKFHF